MCLAHSKCYISVCQKGEFKKKKKKKKVLNFPVFLSGLKILDGNLASINKEAQ